MTTYHLITRRTLPPAPRMSLRRVEWFEAISDMGIGEWITIKPFTTYNESRHLHNSVSQWNKSGEWGADVRVTCRTKWDSEKQHYYVKLCKKQEQGK